MASAGADEVVRALHACRAIEWAMGGLYEVLAELHAHDAGLARLWRKTAIEEASHAAQFSLLIDTMPDCIEAATLSSAALVALYRAVENTLEELALRRPTMRDALVT